MSMISGWIEQFRGASVGGNNKVRLFALLLFCANGCIHAGVVGNEAWAGLKWDLITGLVSAWYLFDRKDGSCRQISLVFGVTMPRRLLINLHCCLKLNIRRMPSAHASREF